MINILAREGFDAVTVNHINGIDISFILFSTIVTCIVYPISTHWCWGSGGWLGTRGYYDFAGSGVVHVSGGIHALVGKN